MSELFEMFPYMAFCGAIIVIALLMPIVGWAMAIYCAFCVFSPVDPLPEALPGPSGLTGNIEIVATEHSTN